MNVYEKVKAFVMIANSFISWYCNSFFTLERSGRTFSQKELDTVRSAEDTIYEVFGFKKMHVSPFDWGCAPMDSFGWIGESKEPDEDGYYYRIMATAYGNLDVHKSKDFSKGSEYVKELAFDIHGEKRSNENISRWGVVGLDLDHNGEPIKKEEKR